MAMLRIRHLVHWFTCKRNLHRLLAAFDAMVNDKCPAVCIYLVALSVAVLPA